MKNARQDIILQIISEENIDTQEMLLDRLHSRGIKSTQATISRDIKELHLIKEPDGNGSYHYVASIHKKHLNFEDKLKTIFSESVLSIDYAQNLVVIKTMSGLANAAAVALDGMQNDEIVGSIAGDDTVFIVFRDTNIAAEFCSEMKSQIKY